MEFGLKIHTSVREKVELQLTPGMRIEIMALERYGEKHYQKYTVSDWEHPICHPDGRWLFSAFCDDIPSVGPCPMIVPASSIRLIKEGD